MRHRIRQQPPKSLKIYNSWWTMRKETQPEQGEGETEGYIFSPRMVWYTIVFINVLCIKSCISQPVFFHLHSNI